MTARGNSYLVAAIVTVASLAMAGVVLSLELRFGTARAWEDGVQFPEVLAVLIKTCGVLHAVPIVATGLTAMVRFASPRESPSAGRSLATVYLISFLLSSLLFSLVLVWWY